MHQCEFIQHLLNVTKVAACYLLEKLTTYNTYKELILITKRILSTDLIMLKKTP
jgi:hypothetical protein